MTSAVLSSKNQITIPSTVRLQLGLQRGDRIAFSPEGKGSFSVQKATDFKSDGIAKKFLQKKSHQGNRHSASRQAAAESYLRRNG